MHAHLAPNAYACTFKKSDRVCKRHEFARIQRRGQRQNGRFLTLVGSRSQIKTGLKGRLGLTVGKKVGDAPVRNLIKRRLRSIFRENRATFDGMDVVVIALPSAAKAPYEDLMRDLLTAASNLKARIAKLSEQRRYGSSRNRQ